ncbi:MAG: protein kinase [Gemmatimonadetes bacterium]|nr:protein kinase [Gemmatimonadota bacterium]
MSDIDASDLQPRLAQALAGQYALLRPLGQGGMGTVFLARDLTLDREVAIKVISPELAASPELKQRFLQEARTVAKLRHPNIVAVYSAGEGNGLLYFVMEFVPGESLRDRLTREVSIASDPACSILHDLALALDYAHQAGVVHRDVKPENILLDRESGRAMLTDFGVAVALAAAGDSRLTNVGMVLGSPRYMSPEQASGERALDGRSDLYSLGLVGYEMLAGEPALDAPSAASMLVKQLTELPPPLIQKAPGTAPEVAAAIDRVLLKEPAARFARGGAFAAALVGESFDNATPSGQVARATRSRSTSAGTANERAPGSRRAVLIGAALAVVAAVGAGAMFVRNRDTGGNTRAYFVAPFEVQTGERSLDWLHEGSVNMLSMALAQWADLSVVDYERSLDLLRNAGLDDERRIALEDARAVARKAGAGVIIMGQVTTTPDSLRVIARTYNVASGKQLDQAESAVAASADPRVAFQSIANELLDLIGGTKVTMELTRATTSSVDAYRAYLAGVQALNGWRLGEADSLLKSATTIDTTFALAYYKRALTLGWINALDRSEHVYTSQKAVDYKSRLPQRLQEIVVANNDLAKAFMANGPEAGALFRAARARLAPLVQRDSLDAEAWYGLADAQFHEATQTGINNVDSIVGLLNQSQRGFKRAIAIDSTNHLAYQHLVGIYSMAAAGNGFVILDGDTLRSMGSPEAMRAIAPARMVELRNAAKARNRDAAAGWLAADPDAHQAWRSLSDAYSQMGMWDSAVAVLERSIERPTTASPVTPYRIALFRQIADDSLALPALRAALQRYPAESLKARGESDRLPMVMSGFSVAGANGALGLLDTLVRVSTDVDSIMFGTTAPTKWIAATYAVTMRMGAGLPASPADRRLLDRSLAGMDQMTSRYAGQVRAQSIVLPYMAFLSTGDTSFAAMARRWATPPNAPPAANVLPELTALIAVKSGDTAGAARLMRDFPSADSLKNPNVPIGMAGLRIFARAQLAADVGDLKRAAGTYEAIDPRRFQGVGMVEPGFATYTRSFLERGKVYEALGERQKAIAAYDEFVRRWAKADAALQPQVAEARAAAARLRDAPASVPVGVKPGRE